MQFMLMASQAKIFTVVRRGRWDIGGILFVSDMGSRLSRRFVFWLLFRLRGYQSSVGLLGPKRSTSE